MRVLVTGGTGHLGRAIVASLRKDGHQIRIIARQPGRDPAVEWVRADVATEREFSAALVGVHAIVHAATSSPAAQRGGFRLVDFVRSPTDVDVGATTALLHAAHDADVQHFVHVSIVGLAQMARGSAYARVKLMAEDRVKHSPVPWSIVRATEFYWLLERMLERSARRGVLLLPAKLRRQPVDSADFGPFVAQCVTDGLRGEREDFVGPELLTVRELAEQYFAVRGLHRRIWNVPLPRRVRMAMEAVDASRALRRGVTTWRRWLTEDAAAARERGLPSVPAGARRSTH